MTSSLAVRRASAADIGLVTSIITLAFVNDPPSERRSRGGG
jgi:hypothetical protein